MGCTGDAPTDTTVATTTTEATTTTAIATTAAPQPSTAVPMAEGIVIDGVIDAAYYRGAYIPSAYQDPAYTTDKSLLVDPTVALAMKTIYQGSEVAERPNTYFALYLLWGREDGVPYLYVAAEIHDETPCVRSGEYMANPNPWLNDALELTYSLGGTAAPVIPAKQDTYPTYNTLVADAREKAATDHTEAAPNHTAVAAQRSYYFDGITSAVTRTDEVTYVVEMKIPAYTESFTGTPGPSFVRTGGRELVAGDCVFICVELLDLTYLPDGYDENMPEEDKYADEWSYSPLGDWAAFENTLQPYMYCGGNRNAKFLRDEGGAPVTFVLTDDCVTPIS